MSGITITDLTWKVKNRIDPILHDVSLHLPEGEFYGIIGPNGSGKTSLIRQIMKLQQPDQGTIRINDRLLSELNRSQLAKLASFMSQNRQNQIDFIVQDVVAMGREPYRKRFSPLQHSDHEQINEALELTKCESLREQKLKHLSAGELQRVIIARTIAQDTPWILLDEPISNLDIRYQIELMQIFDELYRHKGKTIVMILHDLNLAMKYCTKLILIDEGSVYAYGDKKDVLTKENLEAVYQMKFRFVEDDEEKCAYLMPEL
ncbi:MAG: ABC transporter ATP-binding protein [Clostridia bacterium]|nr:ABC transporter ATP-binding protein [Clostridia bacterium]